MTSLTCYRIRTEIGHKAVTDFDDIVDLKDFSGRQFGPIDGDGFSAKAYVVDDAPHLVSWGGFLQSGFNSLEVGRSNSPSALLVVRIPGPTRSRTKTYVYFAFTFGSAGRFLMRGDAYLRGFGLRIALNLIYSKVAVAASRVRAVETRRHGANTLRTASQASSLADFEVFDVNQFRDLVSRATGLPADEKVWGGRVSGGDSLSFNREISFAQLGILSKQIETTFKKSDYKEKFFWIDHIQPVGDPVIVERLIDEVLSRLKTESFENLDLAAPEIVNWNFVSHFRYPFDRPQGAAKTSVLHPDLRLVDFVAGLKRTNRLMTLNYEGLNSRKISAVDGSGAPTYQWSAWNCIVGEVELDDETYVLDEGDFFSVDKDYVSALNKFIDNIPPSGIPFPKTSPSTHEGKYNIDFADSSDEYFLLDKRLVNIRLKTTSIEICDVLSKERQLIHVKRHLGSSDLSHLFSQGFVSAELLQSSPEFRKVASAKILSYKKGKEGFDHFSRPAIDASDFQVVYAIIERWGGRSCSEAMPFFSKVNLREVTSNLQARGYRVALDQIHA